MYCKKCGAEIADDSVFCTKCGLSLKSNSDSNTKVSAKKKISIKKIVLLILLIIVVILGIVYGVYKYNCAKYKENRYLVFGNWNTTDGEVITFETYKSSGNTVVNYDIDNIREEAGGLSVVNAFYLCQYFNLEYSEGIEENISISNEYKLGQNHNLILEIDDNELFIDEISQTEMTINNGHGKTLVLTRQ